MQTNGYSSPHHAPQPFAHPSQPPPPQPYSSQQQGYGFAVVPHVPRRNIALIIPGVLSLVLGLLTLLAFSYNAWQYATVEDHFSDIDGAGWVVEMIKEADMKRMVVFGVLSLAFLAAGFVMGGLGLRKR
jgi:hypothetical protein